MSTQLRSSIITDFEGEKEISSLSIYPKEFHNNPNYEQELKKRGQRYWGFCVPSYRHYEGPTIADRGEPPREVRIQLDNMESSYRINNSINSLQQSHSYCSFCWLIICIAKRARRYRLQFLRQIQIQQSRI